MSSEPFATIVGCLAAVFAGGGTVHADAPGYTLEEQVRRGEQESRAAVRQAVQGLGMGDETSATEQRREPG